MKLKVKVKDDIDLNELTKFGFKIEESTDWYVFDNDENTNIYVKPLSREIFIRFFNRNIRCDTSPYIICELVNHGLLEIVGD